MVRKILVPTDFSTTAEWAVEVAADVALKSGAEIILLHIVEQPTKESFSVEAQINDPNEWEDKLFTLKLIERNKFQLAELEKKISSAGITVKKVMRMGNPYHGISTMISDQKVDLVVMGSSSPSRLEEIMVGSNTEKVVRFSKCPVLTVHQKPTRIQFKEIVYATSLNKDEDVLSVLLKNVQEPYGATVHIVRINTPMNFRSDKEVKIAMELFVRQTKLKNYTLNIFNDYSEEEGIIHFADSINADLIAMATHGRTGLAHILAGSIAEDVVNHSHKPVLTHTLAKSTYQDRYF